MNAEQRIDARLPTQLSVRLKAGAGIDGRARTLHNVSLGGVACFSDEAVKAGQWLTVGFNIGALDLQLRGRVVWCRPNNGRYEIGVRFEEERSSYREQMCEQLAAIEHYRHEILMLEGRQLSSDEAAREWQQSGATDL